MRTITGGGGVVRTITGGGGCANDGGGGVRTSPPRNHELYCLCVHNIMKISPGRIPITTTTTNTLYNLLFSI